jgi:hypothetical protein
MNGWRVETMGETQAGKKVPQQLNMHVLPCWHPHLCYQALGANFHPRTVVHLVHDV